MTDCTPIESQFVFLSLKEHFDVNLDSELISEKSIGTPLSPVLPQTPTSATTPAVTLALTAERIACMTAIVEHLNAVVILLAQIDGQIPHIKAIMGSMSKLLNSTGCSYEDEAGLMSETFRDELLEIAANLDIDGQEDWCQRTKLLLFDAQRQTTRLCLTFA